MGYQRRKRQNEGRSGSSEGWKTANVCLVFVLVPLYIALDVWTYFIQKQNISVLSNVESAIGNRLSSFASERGPSKALRASQVSPKALLTIAVDHYVSCPDRCTFTHPLLPAWVQYRYIDFEDEVDLQAMLQEDRFSHVLLVCRTNIVKLAAWASRRRSDTNKTVGLWHMADERYVLGEIKPYPHFDYVIRNYFRPDFPASWMTLRALGNHSCGSSPPLPVPNSRKEPRWGLHWAPLNPHELDILLQRHPSSVWPIRHRPVNCSFIGRRDCKRSRHQRQYMQEAMENIVPELNCSIQFTTGFAQGKTKFEYFNHEIEKSKIGMNPSGSNVETHRLAEILPMGTVPAVIDKAYLHATFETVPGIIGRNWTEIALEMRRLVLDQMNGGDELQMLSFRGARFYEKLQRCMKKDVDIILQNAFFL